MTTLRGLFGKVKDGARENPFGVPAEARLDAQRERTRPKEESPAAVRVAAKAFPPGTKLVAVSHVSYATGARLTSFAAVQHGSP